VNAKNTKSDIFSYFQKAKSDSWWTPYYFFEQVALKSYLGICVGANVCTWGRIHERVL